jgi:hypothetical protein
VRVIKTEALAAEPVGEPTEEKCPEHGAGEIEAARKPDLGITEAETGALLERSGDGTGKRYLEAVENPGNAEGDDDEAVESSPVKPVEPRRDGGFNQR